MTRQIALLRGINVSGKNMIPMPELAKLCAKLGWKDVRTYIQSGNVVFDAPAKDAEEKLEGAIHARFGFDIPVIVRSASRWERYAKAHPFGAVESKFVLLALSKRPPLADCAATLTERAQAGEVIQRDGDAVWIHFASGVGRSKLSPAVLDRLVGSTVTARNWNTVQKLAELARA